MKYLTTERIPTWALYYLEYGEFGLYFTDEDASMVDAWVKRHFPRGFVMEPHKDEYYDEEHGPQPYFTHIPAFGPAAEVVDMDFYDPTPKTQPAMDKHFFKVLVTESWTKTICVEASDPDEACDIVDQGINDGDDVFSADNGGDYSREIEIIP